ncbi:MAG TPA: glutamate--cysteine ligase [Candidatus Tenderia electrophaga]|uniref:Glutamate--cysteine ligase n=1 Tax=Candidatus Tenderia electrophaga TaxID=1748243 RepID=A0A832J728_9GAMM|nr:glutamate--cysteine ligase [Candidatus Tenderia electrophaga]
MGEEIGSSHFRQKDFQRFLSNLSQETSLLGDWFDQGRFCDTGKMAGFELEAWLVNADGHPHGINDAFLRLAERDGLPVVPELSRFNVEINSEPRELQGKVLSKMFAELESTWRQCCGLAQQLDAAMMMTGILPTVKDSELILANMSEVKRFRALNDQVLRLRNGRPLDIDIQGVESLRMSHGDVMFESAATSFQLHFQVGISQSARYYNTAHILSAPMVAVSANSPYLFGRDLWDETRIPLFEQAVAMADVYGRDGAQAGRVTFGAAYIESSLYECFLRNLGCYPILLPALNDAPVDALAHLRLHNGTIWRWNRPLIGFDDSGQPHLRIEHRVVPAGPTVVDSIANAALFYGALESMANAETAPDSLLGFEQARTNFYAAAKHGLRAEVVWLDGKKVPVLDLLQQQILPLAQQGLARLGIDSDDAELFLAVIDGRIKKQCNGAVWQRGYVARHGADMVQLTQAYYERQQQGQPVHEWSW